MGSPGVRTVRALVGFIGGMGAAASALLLIAAGGTQTEAVRRLPLRDG